MTRFSGSLNSEFVPHTGNHRDTITIIMGIIVAM